jgi:hypothetical protein
VAQQQQQQLVHEVRLRRQVTPAQVAAPAHLFPPAGT